MSEFKVGDSVRINEKFPYKEEVGMEGWVLEYDQSQNLYKCDFSDAVSARGKSIVSARGKNTVSGVNTFFLDSELLDLVEDKMSEFKKGDVIKVTKDYFEKEFRGAIGTIKKIKIRTKTDTTPKVLFRCDFSDYEILKGRFDKGHLEDFEIYSQFVEPHNVELKFKKGDRVQINKNILRVKENSDYHMSVGTVVSYDYFWENYVCDFSADENFIKNPSVSFPDSSKVKCEPDCLTLVESAASLKFYASTRTGAAKDARYKHGDIVGIRPNLLVRGNKSGKIRGPSWQEDGDTKYLVCTETDDLTLGEKDILFKFKYEVGQTVRFKGSVDNEIGVIDEVEVVWERPSYKCSFPVLNVASFEEDLALVEKKHPALGTEWIFTTGTKGDTQTYDMNNLNFSDVAYNGHEIKEAHEKTQNLPMLSSFKTRTTKKGNVLELKKYANGDVTKFINGDRCKSREIGCFDELWTEAGREHFNEYGTFDSESCKPVSVAESNAKDSVSSTPVQGTFYPYQAEHLKCPEEKRILNSPFRGRIKGIMGVPPEEVFTFMLKTEGSSTEDLDPGWTCPLCDCHLPTKFIAAMADGEEVCPSCGNNSKRCTAGQMTNKPLCNGLLADHWDSQNGVIVGVCIECGEIYK